MAKLTAMQKEQFQICRDVLRNDEMRVFFSRELRMMVGIVSDFGAIGNPLIYRMCVTLCNPKDEFKKKLGLIELCNKFENDKYNQVRVNNASLEYFVCAYMQLFANGNEFDVEEMELN